MDNLFVLQSAKFYFFFGAAFLATTFFGATFLATTFFFILPTCNGKYYLLYYVLTSICYIKFYNVWYLLCIIVYFSPVLVYAV